VEVALGVTLGLTVWVRVRLGRVGCTCRETPDTLGGQAGAALTVRYENPPDCAHP
jgi:hypothetical protein